MSHSSKKICTKQWSSKIYETKADETERKIDKSTVIVGEFNTPFSTTDKTWQNTKKYKRTHNTINQKDLIDIYRTLHPTTKE